MKMNDTTAHRSITVSRTTLFAALAIALARLVVVGTIIAWLVVTLLNAVADALVFALVGVIALLMSSCPVHGTSTAVTGRAAPAPSIAH